MPYYFTYKIVPYFGKINNIFFIIFWLFFYALREPNATKVEKEGYGYVVASVGELGGVAPYTAYNARKSFIENNPDKIKGFIKAINKALEFVRSNDSKIVAETILSEFPDMSIEELASSIERYKKQDTWNNTTTLTKESFDHLQEIMIKAKELKDKVPFEDLVENKYNW